MGARVVALDQTEERWTMAVERFVAGDAGRSVRVSGRGLTVGVADDVVRPGASVNKLFVAIAAGRAADEHDLDLDQTVAVDDLPPSAWPSVTLALRPDHRLSFAELTGLMLATSDNRIADHLVRHLGPERITTAARSIGCADTTLAVGFADEHLGPSGRANVTTARDCDQALATIAREPALAWLRPPMRSSLYNSRILARLPDDVVVSHKTGTLSGVVNDVGIVHAPGGDLAVSFLTDGQADHARTSADIALCVREVFDAALDTRVAG